jgi:DNA-binding protein HU-beta
LEEPPPGWLKINSSLTTRRRNEMTKADLVKLLSEKTGATQSEASKAIDAVFEGLKGALVNGEAITVVGFGTLKVMERSERQGRNPRTGEAITIAAQKTVKFSIGKRLKEHLNPPHAKGKAKKKT